MRLIFAGTPAFSVPALDSLVAAGHEVVAVYTQPDRPAGRGQKLSASPVAQRAAQLGLPLAKPSTLRNNADEIAALHALAPDAMVVVAYGLILPQAVLDIPRHGCLNIHASLLPRWRGAAPIQRAVLAGDACSGITIMRMEAGLDTGPMLLHEPVPVSAHTTAGELHDALSPLGARLIVQALHGLARGTLTEQAQPADGVTYASKLTKEEARLDFSRPAAELVRRIHGYNPMPGAWCECRGERLKLLRATRVDEADAVDGSSAGKVIALDGAGLLLGTGRGRLRVTELQRPGGRPTTPALAFAGRPSLIGEALS